jgi:two-component system response regulator MprA
MTAVAGRKPLVLLVEDDARSARLLARMLRDDGWEVEIALDGGAALSRLANGRAPDALVTDFRLPHANGLALAQFARSRDAHIPVVIVTGYPQLVDVDALDPQPIVFTKPIAYPALTAALPAPR